MRCESPGDLYFAIKLTKAWSIPQRVNKLRKLGRTMITVKSPYSEGESILATRMTPTAFTIKETKFPMKRVKPPLID